MNVVKCSNGHFFDGDTYSACPHCGASVETKSQPKKQENKGKKRGIFGGHKSKGEYIPPQQWTPSHPQEEISFEGANNTAENRLNIQGASPQPAEKRGDVTLDFWQTSSSSSPIEPSTDDKGSSDSYTSDDAAPSYGKRFDSKEQDDSPSENPSSNTISLKDAVRQASASSEGKTMSYFSSVTNRGDNKQERAASSPNPVDPVVGWLVCIQGEHFGESFNIGAGMNSVGRNETNRIVLTRDSSISREKHALITYEPKHRKFYVKPGDSSGLTYLNDEYITETKALTERDIIELGNSKFIFVPLCCDSFTWEDYIKG